MTTPFPFVAAQVLTAAQLNAITELVVNDKTASYTLVAGDAGERVIMNSASATTITVNTSIFTAGQLVYVTNKGAGVCTVTAGTATVSTTGTLALAQFASGVLYCISAGVFIFEAYGVAASSSGLTQIVAETAFTGVTTITADNVFTSTYSNYLILWRATSGSGAMTLQYRVGGVTTTTSYQRQMFISSSTTNTGERASDAVIGETSNNAAFAITVYGPQIAAETLATSLGMRNASSNITVDTVAHKQTASTQFDGFILTIGSASTGYYSVYGYKK